MSSFIGSNENTMMITLTENVIDELTLQLNYVLNSNETLTIDLNNVQQVLDYCIKLMTLLYKYDSNIVNHEMYSNLHEIYNNLLNSEVISPIFLLNTNHFEYYILSHLCTSLQTYRILSYNKSKSKRAEVAGNRGIISFQLEKICKDLDLNTDDLNNELDVFDHVQKKVLQSIDDITIPILTNTPKILNNITIDEKRLSILSKIEESLYNDFLQRRKMLIKRLDVTIQSFLWGKKSKGKEQDIDAAIKAQRQFLKEEPKFFRSIDALNAPLSLLYQHSKKVTEHNHNSRSLVKTIIIGAVPDRGGRTTDIRPKGGSGGFGGGGGGHHHHKNNKNNGKNDNSNSNSNSKLGKNNKSNKSNNNNNNNQSNNNSNNSNNNKGRVVTMTS